MIDNESFVKFLNEFMYHIRMKPFRIHLKFTKELTRNEHIKMLHITCVHQCVSALTKILAIFF
jgi:hypothetical protein